MPGVTCGSCGTQQQAGRFCGNCGAAISSAAPRGAIPEAAIPLQAGMLLLDRYTLIGRVGGGTFGEVWKATDVRSSAQCAVKRVPFAADSDQGPAAKQRAWFEREAQILQHLTSPGDPHICRFLDMFKRTQEPDCGYLVMEFVEGPTLLTVLQERQSAGDGPLPEDQVAGYARQLGDALAYMHSRRPPVIYRDLKPDNVILRGGDLVLIDFGTAYLQDRAGTTALGTPGYAPLEQYRDGGQVDAKLDQYALAATLYHLLTGVRPPDAQAGAIPRADTLSSGLRASRVEALARALSPDPGARFDDVVSFVDAFAGVGGSKPRRRPARGSRTPSTVPADASAAKSLAAPNVNAPASPMAPVGPATPGAAPLTHLAQPTPLQPRRRSASQLGAGIAPTAPPSPATVPVRRRDGAAPVPVGPRSISFTRTERPGALARRRVVLRGPIVGPLAAAVLVGGALLAVHSSSPPVPTGSGWLAGLQTGQIAQIQNLSTSSAVNGTTATRDPLAVASGNGGLLLVLDQSSASIWAANLGATPIHRYGRAIGAGGFVRIAGGALVGVPRAVAVDRTDNAFIAGGGRVAEIQAGDGRVVAVAGTGMAGDTGDGSPAQRARVDVGAIAVDDQDNLFIAQRRGGEIREVRASRGAIATVARGPVRLDPHGLAADSAGDLFVADAAENRVWEVRAGTGRMAVVAGTGQPGFSGDGGSAIRARLHTPEGVAVDSAGNLYIADSTNNRVREVIPARGIMQTVVGSGIGAGGDGGPATSAQLDHPAGVSVDSAGDVFIADTGNSRVRVVKRPATGLTKLEETR